MASVLIHIFSIHRQHIASLHPASRVYAPSPRRLDRRASLGLPATKRPGLREEPARCSHRKRLHDSRLPPATLSRAPVLFLRVPVRTGRQADVRQYTLRRIYYSSAAGEQNLEAFDNGVDRHSHVAHCFEYLRQALMCCADPSLEPFEPPEGGFPGMGFERQCRDYDGLKAWAEEWRTMEVKSFILDDLSHNRSIGGRLR